MVVPVLTTTISPSSGSRVSFKDGHNKIVLKYSSDISLQYAEVRITKGTTDYDIGVGYLAYVALGNIQANTQHTVNIDINSTTFSEGDGHYTISIYAKNHVDGSWSEYHYFLTVDGLSFVPSGSSGLEVVTDQAVPQ